MPERGQRSKVSIIPKRPGPYRGVLVGAVFRGLLDSPTPFAIMDMFYFIFINPYPKDLAG